MNTETFIKTGIHVFIKTRINRFMGWLKSESSFMGMLKILHTPILIKGLKIKVVLQNVCSNMG